MLAGQSPLLPPPGESSDPGLGFPAPTGQNGSLQSPGLTGSAPSRGDYFLKGAPPGRDNMDLQRLWRQQWPLQSQSIHCLGRSA